MKTSFLKIIPLLLIATSCRKPTTSDITKTKISTESKSPAPFSIAIDPGHGGKDPGTKSSIPPYVQEKTVTLATALKVAEFLRRQGYVVEMTRKSDTFLSLQDRTLMTKKKKCKLFISIHYNHAQNQNASGIEVYYYKDQKNPKRTELSHELGTAILNRMVSSTKSVSRGVHHGNFHVIRNVAIPAVLIEAGFLSNKKEAIRLKNSLYIHKLAWGIAKGADDFIKKTSSKIVPGAN